MKGGDGAWAKPVGDGALEAATAVAAAQTDGTIDLLLRSRHPSVRAAALEAWTLVLDEASARVSHGPASSLAPHRHHHPIP